VSQGPAWPVARPCAARRSRMSWPGGLTTSLQGLPSPCDAPIRMLDSLCRKEQNSNLLCSDPRPGRYENNWDTCGQWRIRKKFGSNANFSFNGKSHYME
jgi:hypothetical protein